MNLIDIVERAAMPEPWAEGEKIPWNEPGFSARMLVEHLSQQHDAASRRAEIIERQVGWIHEHVLGGRSSRILDLGCGPGLYAQRLAALGHSCVGIDFGPASIAYARQQAAATGASCVYVEGDIRSIAFGPDGAYDLAMLLYGEFNVFRRSEVATILAKACQALGPGGYLVLEPHTYEAVQEIGSGPAIWHTCLSGLFSDRPYLLLYEPLWHAEQAIAIERYYVVNAGTAKVSRYASSMHAYRDMDYRHLLQEAGFSHTTFYPSLTGEAEPSQSALQAIVAQR